MVLLDIRSSWIIEDGRARPEAQRIGPSRDGTSSPSTRRRLVAVELAKSRRTRNVRAARESEAHLVRLADLVSPAEIAELEAVFVTNEPKESIGG